MHDELCLVDIHHSYDGLLSVVEFGRMPWVPRRAFWVISVPRGKWRGNHVHYRTRQEVKR